MTKAEAFAQAMLDQLNAEIGASGYTIKSLAKAEGRDYNTFRRYVKGERPMPMIDLWSAIDRLGIDQVEFARRALDRVSTVEQAHRSAEQK